MVEMTDETLQLRIYGDRALPTLIYLPGLHGDWTLVTSFREAVAGKVCFVEMTYPRTLTWSLEDYAAAIESALHEHGVTHGWLLGESFGSQVLWAIVGRRKFSVDAVVLAGGFVKHAMRWAVRLAEKLAGRISLRAITWMIFAYGRFARYRYRHAPETMVTLDEFAKRRTPEDLKAAQHRLHLIAENDPCPIASRTGVPVFALTGFLDPIVPWPFVRKWLRTNCTALRDYRVLRQADHNVLGTAPKRSAEQILEWINRFTG